MKNITIRAQESARAVETSLEEAMTNKTMPNFNMVIATWAHQHDLNHVRIYSKNGFIRYSDNTEELNTQADKRICSACHGKGKNLNTPYLLTTVSFFPDSGGKSGSMNFLSVIRNRPSCSNNSCHVHSKDGGILGILDLGYSLEKMHAMAGGFKGKSYLLAVLFALVGGTITALLMRRYVTKPISKLVDCTKQIAEGRYDTDIDTGREDEIGQLARAIKDMGLRIAEKQEALRRKQMEYQDLFNKVPCYITVQDRTLRLIKFNRQFQEKFSPSPGQYCYEAYKGRTHPCEKCPVISTFKDGKSHTSEETGVNKDGTVSSWIVRTAPIKDPSGDVVAAMEMCLDVTQMKELQQEVKKSEEKYRVIFNTIPNPLFVLDAHSLQIIDCNYSVTWTYGFDKSELTSKSFLVLFPDDERDFYERKIRESDLINRVKHIRKDGETIFVNIRISPSEYLDREVLLVTTSDITERMMAEQQLIQASKMATLGEMATGVAHELNQPLSVIKTASSFIKNKVMKNESIGEEVLKTLACEIDSHVDRATKIINHMREFGRKSGVKKEKVDVNNTMLRALEIFSQQLKLREIEIVLGLQENLPVVYADSNRLEQVFINFLINARDAIEEKARKAAGEKIEKKIFVQTAGEGGYVVVRIRDTGTGIPESIKEKIFEPFFTTKEVGKGTGLGLSISYGIINDYNGIIRVKSKENQGAEFTILFPVGHEDL